MTVPRIQAVVFDCFGTLVEITEHTRPYHHLLSLAHGEKRGDYSKAVMTHRWDLRDAAMELQIPASEAKLAALEKDLEEELSSIKCFEETMDMLRLLRTRGLRLALCSNLAQPYATPVKTLLGNAFDVEAWSFDIGYAKPDPEIYRYVSSRLDVKPGLCLFVGDTESADFIGPREAGFHALLLRRGSNDSETHSHRISSLRDLLVRL
jgi:HAD superfamily hydrolase (TIGR01549 family)